MGTTKKNLFTEDQNRIAEMAKAIGHPARVAILMHLLNKGACVCGSIVDQIPLSQSTISQHLKALKNAGLIKGDIDGNSICYCIDEQNWTLCKKAMSNFFTDVSPCC